MKILKNLNGFSYAENPKRFSSKILLLLFAAFISLANVSAGNVTEVNRSVIIPVDINVNYTLSNGTYDYWLYLSAQNSFYSLNLSNIINNNNTLNNSVFNFNYTYEYADINALNFNATSNYYQYYDNVSLITDVQNTLIGKMDKVFDECESRSIVYKDQLTECQIKYNAIVSNETTLYTQIALKENEAERANDSRIILLVLLCLSFLFVFVLVMKLLGYNLSDLIHRKGEKQFTGGYGVT